MFHLPEVLGEISNPLADDALVLMKLPCLLQQPGLDQELSSDRS